MMRWKEKWHLWFAWRPVTARDGESLKLVWFKFVQRKGTYCTSGGNAEYGIDSYVGYWYEWDYQINKS